MTQNDIFLIENLKVLGHNANYSISQFSGEEKTVRSFGSHFEMLPPVRLYWSTQKVVRGCSDLEHYFPIPHLTGLYPNL